MTNTKKTFGLFPGQGSQQVGMGKALYEQSELARDIFENANQALGFSLSEICFEGPTEKLTSTAIAQPAILTVSYICFQLAHEQFPEFKLCGAAGHSLGEYSALVASGALSFADAVVLVNKRGRYMQEAVPQGEGKMVAVLGKDLAEIEQALAKVENGVVQAANINAPGQIVIAGASEAVDSFVEHMGTAKIKELPVSAPFHCALMKPAAENLAKDLATLEIKPAAFPIYANYSATALQDPEQIRSSLVSQVCGQVRWIECIQNAWAELKPELAIEFGLGRTLSGLLRRIYRKAEVINIDSVQSAAGVSL